MGVRPPSQRDIEPECTLFLVINCSVLFFSSSSFSMSSSSSSFSSSSLPFLLFFPFLVFLPLPAPDTTPAVSALGSCARWAKRWINTGYRLFLYCSPSLERMVSRGGIERDPTNRSRKGEEEKEIFRQKKKKKKRRRREEEKKKKRRSSGEYVNRSHCSRYPIATPILT